MQYAMTEASTRAAQSVLEHYGITDSQVCNIEIFYPDEALPHCHHDWNYPLLLDDSAVYFAHQQGMQAIEVVKARVLALSEIDATVGGLYGREVEGFAWGNGHTAHELDLQVCAGVPVLNLLKSSAFVVDWARFGFASFMEFLTVTSAHLANLHAYSDYYEMPGWRSVLADGTEVVNRYARHTHGDLRFNQYRVTPTLTVSPWEDQVPFYPAKSRTLAAYHSTECGLLAILLRFADEQGCVPSVLAEYPDYVARLRLEGSHLGNFGDAGMVTAWHEHFLLEHPLVAKDQLADCRHQLAKEVSGAESAFVDGEELCFAPAGVRFTVADIDPLIRALHESCRLGYGRTSLTNLVDFCQKVLNKRTEDADVPHIASEHNNNNLADVSASRV